ncbi:MAG: PilZ domain-containing protein [bacterium]|jgi:c-di-GMP-binding flagellar brake protein YcgR|nr:PilZ domain-containing protein [bacterium]MBK7045282.1 PilZ domain-containing protein [bacterium]MBK7187781.1 PilZ domain-containing protein [bacterium]MBK7672241.1 PilZ domain-containing protein [bacterium]MBK7769047.1 PilZ domain-containing protein [bacterium]
MADNRHRPRKNTPHNVKVVDEESGRVMGRVVDITADGMMLVTNGEITPGRQFQVRITLPVMVQHRSDVTVEARAVWCNQDTNPSFYKVGFKFLNLVGEEGYLLEDVMHRLNLVG